MRDFFLSFVFPKRIPSHIGRGSVLVTPRADIRVLYPGWERSANDLMMVAERYVAKDAVVWDIGGNLGIFSMFSAAKAGAGGQVFAVEPDPHYASLISRSALRQGPRSSPVKVLCAAVSDTIAVADFSVSAKGHARSALSAVSGQSQSVSYVRPVPTLTLDFLAEYWPAPDLIKIDVEGAEVMLLAGAGELLSRHRPTLYIEVLDDNAEAAGKLLNNYGYSLFKLNANGEVAIEFPGMYTIARPSESA